MTQKHSLLRLLVWALILSELLGFALAWSPVVLREFGITMQFAPRGLTLAEARSLMLPRRLIGAALGSLALIAMLVGLWRLDQMLCKLHKEAIFSLPNIAHLRGFSLCLGVSTGLSILEVPARSVLFQVCCEGASRVVKAQTNSSDFVLLLVCAVFYLVADTMHQARRIALENEGFV